MTTPRRRLRYTPPPDRSPEPCSSGPSPRVGLLLSRQPRFITPEAPWLAAARSAVHELAIRGATALCGTGHGAWEFVHWLCRRAGVGLELFDAERDAELIQGADEFVSIAVRPRGRMMTLAREAEAAGKRVRAAHAFGSNYPRGPDHGPDTARPDTAGPDTAGPDTAARFELPPSCSAMSAGYLWHYTRARAGPWPGETREEWFEALSRSEPGSVHSAPQALARILAEKRIRSNGSLIRGNRPVVCFSARPPAILKDLRRFRCWLGRWDYEPWAIGIRCEVAQDLGARPVTYLPSAAYASLAPDQQWRFQKHEPPVTDWSHEEEWRILGDVDLSRLSRAEWVVYHHPP